MIKFLSIKAYLLSTASLVAFGFFLASTTWFFALIALIVGLVLDFFTWKCVN